MSGTLYIIATPIGNLEDISKRAMRILGDVDVIVCEDTRHTGLLLSTLNIKAPKLVSYYDEVELKRAPELIELLEQGKSIALVSDAGTPLISDPGYVLISSAHKAGIPVRTVPGPSAAVAALSLSGLPPTPYMFVGFPPEREASRVKQLQSLPTDTTLIFFVAPHKLAATLEDMKSIWGDVQIVICRELTKQFEETWRGTIGEALSSIERFKGELVLLKR
jgi:16S rRNA (cytidine1402-2'-O)-methyltransferase